MKITALAAGLVSLAGLLTAAAPFTLTADGSLAGSATITAMVESQLVVGDRLTTLGDFEAAREVYDVAAKMMRVQGKLPVDPLRRIANAFYFESQYDSAAVILDGLAEEASSIGDPVNEIWAIADAARMAWLHGAIQDAEQRSSRALALLDSSDLPKELRAEIRTKLTSDMTVFAPHLAAR
ncbi:MAG: hypothetical protein JSV41_09665 [Gemmatimonadota bacterium]|nr:MAG: hypothetical protein JSV41_09665 [Gemmatimonadota bacterium]